MAKWFLGDYPQAIEPCHKRRVEFSGFGGGVAVHAEPHVAGVVVVVVGVAGEAFEFFPFGLQYGECPAAGGAFAVVFLAEDAFEGEDAAVFVVAVFSLVEGDEGDGEGGAVLHGFEHGFGGDGGHGIRYLKRVSDPVYNLAGT